MSAKANQKETTRLSADERREAILEAALTVFAKSGFHSSTIEDIAQAAGISKALIYEHFHSKRELYNTLIETCAKDLIDRLAVSAAVDKRAGVRLEKGVDAFFQYVEEDRDAWRVLYSDSIDSELVGKLKSARDRVNNAVAALLYAERETRDLSPDERKREVEMLALLLIGANESLADWWMDHPDVPRSKLVGRVMDFAWLGLERIEAGESWTSKEGDS